MRKLTIVGGGSSGWMTANYLNNLYNKHDNNVEITVVESKDIDVLGVGEATVPTIRTFFQAMGIDETELLKATNATFKNGILFRDWKKGKPDHRHEYLHPFEMQKLANRYDISHEWLLKTEGKETIYDHAVSLSSALVYKNHAPKGKDSKDYQGIVPYGYHLDARLLGQYLRERAIKLGVNRLEATVSKVHVEGENITYLETDNGEVKADFFIDCTGFRALLISELEQDNWRSFAKELLCDRAVTIQTPYKEGESINAYTMSTALENGWVWDIGLKDRKGCGYVYSSKHTSPEEAEAALREYIGCSDELTAAHIPMKIGCRKQHWIGNCLALGLSGGFIEPLESTGLHLIHMSNFYFSTHYTSVDTNQIVRDSYNNLINKVYDELKDFIVLHYALTDRDDSEFWLAAQKTSDYCPALKSRLELWKHKVCENYDLNSGESSLFTELNYKYVLFGMQYYPKLSMEYHKYEFQGIADEMRHRHQSVIGWTLPHSTYLNTLHNS